MENLVLLCEGHHLAHHAGEFRIVPLDHQQFRYIQADGTVLPGHVDAAGHISSGVALEDEYDDIDPLAAMTDWRGDRLDRHWATGVLAGRRELAWAG
jgi:hypothetical protein